MVSRQHPAPSHPEDREADAHWMLRALEQARGAAEQDEVPVGAVVVSAGSQVGAAGNRIEETRDATAHAEMLALRQASECLGTRRLDGTTLYVTLEPCAMCAGAIVLARVSRLVFGAFDPKAGACGTLRNVVQDPRLNHTCQVLGGVLHDECAGLLQRFFEELRAGDRSHRRGA